ncbi:hypothetical protein EUGRSUZ_L01696 [Eucalyptus grandis]|uniref:Bulb-type lectin domain-containing protein n=1 Tax=Eucalyptus grandis TaxID=71139 RepID=A0A058ZTJ3_EUCGR|nr:hypothetical protein EUGRSUZ_L01696 [Eucalyptus grandis]
MLLEFVHHCSYDCVFVYSLLVCSLFQALQSSTIYNITASRPLIQNQTLVSPSKIFELGFFAPNGSEKQYVGIWYKNTTFSKVVWVANRDKPLGHKDHLRLLDGRQNTVWSTNVMAKSNYSAAVLSDFGNLVLQDGNANEMWESFDEPTDTLLPNMKIGVNVKTGKKKKYSISWKGEDDPLPGSFVLGVTSETPPRLFAWNGSNPCWRSGQWDKSKFNGMPTMSNTYRSGYELQQNIDHGTTYYSRHNYNNFSFGYSFISSEGSIESVRWGDGWSKNWEASRTNRCEIYGTCGPFGVCNTFSSPICRCLKGFKPRSDEKKMELNCHKSAHAAAMTTVEKDVFWQMKHMKLPDSADYLSNIADAEGCRSWCLGNCSCLAFPYADAVGCMAWCEKLIDIQQFYREGKDLYYSTCGCG